MAFQATIYCVGLSSHISASRLSPVFPMFTETQLPPPHRLLLLGHPLSPRPVPYVLGCLLRALPPSPLSSASWTRARGQ